MDKTDYIILILLFKKSGNEIKSLTIKEIKEKGNIECKINTLYKKIKKLECMGYIKKGIKDRKAHTFFLSQTGREYLENKRTI